MEETRALVEMSDDEVIETLQTLVFGSYGRTTPKERYAVSRAIDIIRCNGKVKSVQEQTLSDLYPTMHCAIGTCGGCDELYVHDGKGCLGDLFKYTCKKKDITILYNTTPKPENFVKE